MGKSSRITPQVVTHDDDHQLFEGLKDQILNEKQAAMYLNMSVKALQAWRFYGKGPRYSKILGRSIRYRKVDLDAFFEATMIDPVA